MEPHVKSSLLGDRVVGNSANWIDDLTFWKEWSCQSPRSGSSKYSKSNQGRCQLLLVQARAREAPGFRSRSSAVFTGPTIHPRRTSACNMKEFQGGVRPESTGRIGNNLELASCGFRIKDVDGVPVGFEAVTAVPCQGRSVGSRATTLPEWVS